MQDQYQSTWYHYCTYLAYPMPKLWHHPCISIIRATQLVSLLHIADNMPTPIIIVSRYPKVYSTPWAKLSFTNPIGTMV